MNIMLQVDVDNEDAFPIKIDDGYQGIALSWEEWDKAKDYIESKRNG